MEKKLQIRPFQTADTIRCCEIINACVPLMQGLNHAAQELVLSKNSPSTLIDELQPGYTVVCLKQKIIIGVGMLNVEQAEIKRVYIDPAYHHQGAGRLIMKTLETEAIQQNIDTVTVQSSLNAVSFYEALGYQPLDRDSLIKDEAVFEWLDMSKNL